MKKIILSAAALLITLMAYAQPHAVTINNNATCDVYIVFYGDRAPGCGTGYRSLVTITAPGSFTYNVGSLGMSNGVPGSPPLTASDNINLVRVYYTDPFAGCTSNHVSVDGCGGPTIAYFDHIDPLNCGTYCNGVGGGTDKVEWTSPVAPSTTATVDIN